MKNNIKKTDSQYVVPTIEIINFESVYTFDVSAFDGEEHSFDFMSWINS